MRALAAVLLGFLSISLLGWGHSGPRVKVGFVGKDPFGHSVFLKKLRESLDEENADLVIAGAGESPKTLLDMGAQALIFYGADPGVGLLSEVRTKGVPVLSLEKPIEGGQDFLVAYDPQKEGDMQARTILRRMPGGIFVLVRPKNPTWFSRKFQDGQQKVLQPALARGDIRIKTLQENPSKVAAWLAFDPKDTKGIRDGKEKKGWKGVLGGVGEDLDTCRAIRTGTQIMTVYRSPLKLAEETAYLAAKAARKAKTFDCQFVEVPTGKESVKTVLLTPKVLEAGDLEDTVIKDGVWTREEVFGKK